MTFNAINTSLTNEVGNGHQYDSESENSQSSLGSNAENVSNQSYSASSSDNEVLVNNSDDIRERIFFSEEKTNCMALNNSIICDLKISRTREAELTYQLANLADPENSSERKERITNALSEIDELDSYFKQAEEKIDEAIKGYSYSYEDGIEINFAVVRALLEEARSIIDTTINSKLDLLEQNINQISQ